VLVQGGGIGLDQAAAVQRLIAAAGVEIDWQVIPAGLAALRDQRPALSNELFDAIKKTGVALKTKLLHPHGGGDVNFNIQFRNNLGLFASVRPIHNLQGLKSRFPNLDILLVREITEDLYSAIEHVIVPGVVQSIKVVTEAACMRFFEFTFELAKKNNRKTIHCIHKANILKMADGLFLDCFRRTAAKYPELTPKELIVDNACMQLVARPQQFDVLATGNLYGDLLSDLGAGLIGGISATAAISHGPGVRVYEAIHGGLREWIGEDKANPMPLLCPALHMLRDLGETEAATRLLQAAERVFTAGQVRTPDLGGTDGTKAMTEAIIQALPLAA
jgi:isocitrate dehydrogenase (NAD+)